jgi:hypothetical protein
MQKFTASGCCLSFARLGQTAQIASIASNPNSVKDILEACRGGGAIQEQVPPAQIDEIRIGLLLPALSYCKEAELLESQKMIQHLIGNQFKDSVVTNAELQWALHSLQRLMASEMSERLFFSISKSFATKFDDPYPMCKEVSDAFPLAKDDIREAYNCLVLDRNTAAVFHSMRIAEHGLRSLARKLKVKLTHKGKPQPIVSATWDKIITEIKNRINAAHATPHGAYRQRQLTHYSDMADRCSYMKDLWRNEIMHTRRSYNKEEAAGAVRRVSEFMNLLAIKRSD